MIDRRWLVAAAVILFGSICYFVGRKSQATADALAANKIQIAASDSSTKSVQIRTDTSRKEAYKLDSAHNAIRTKVRVVHDTVTTPGGDYIDPALARLIFVDDSLISAQKHALALQDTLVASLRTGIALRDTRIKLLESRGTSRFSKGIQIGAGYCATALGQSPCLFAGYGFSLRLP